VILIERFPKEQVNKNNKLSILLLKA